MKHVPVAAFKDHVSEYVAEAQAGEEIVITRHGKEAARLVPPRNDKAALRKEAVKGMRTIRASLAAQGIFTSSAEIRQWIEEDRK
jgi:prevent-host-death family protein